MRFGKSSLAAVAAAALVSAPVLAQPAKVGKPVAAKVERQGADRKDESKLHGGFIIPLLAVIAIIGGILIAAGNDDDTPTSP